MSDATELVFGFLLWLVSCGFIFNLCSNKAKFSPELNKKKSLNLLNRDRISEEKVVLDRDHNNLEKTGNIQNGINPQHLAKLQQELAVAKETINVLLAQLEAKSNQWELLQDKSSQLETELRQQNQKCQAKINDLEKQYQQLKADFQDHTFKQLHSLFTNYPTAKVMAKVKPDLPAKNLVALFKPLDNLLSNWNFHPIGKPWQKVAYNPQLHQPDSQDLKIGELVYIRFIGYRHGDRILSPAKVSRTLPGKQKK
jgi:molecular chaperone GrpE (heat shock protein)